MCSRCLSAAGLSFCGHPSPARDSAPLAIGLPARSRAGPRRDTTFRTREMRPEWAPSLPRDLRCSREPVIIPGPPPAALPRHGSYHPGTAVTHPGLPVTRHQSRVHVLRPPGLPLTRGPRMTRGTLRLSPGLRTHADRTRARTPGQGQAQSTSPEQRHQHYVMLALQSARFTRNMVRSARSALPALPLVGFSEPPPEPAVPITGQRALRKSQPGS